MSTIRTRISRLTAASALAVSVFVMAVAPAPSGADVSPPLLIESANSAKAVDIPGASHVPGTQLIQWTEHGDDNQLWHSLDFATIGDVHLFVFVSVESGLVLDVAGGSSADGAAVVQTAWAGTPSQVWWAADYGGEATVLVNMGSGKVLDVAGASHADGAPLIQWAFNGGLNQVWFAVFSG